MNIFHTFFIVFVADFEQTFIFWDKKFILLVRMEKIYKIKLFFHVFPFLMPLGNVGSTKANKREIFERKVSNRINTGATEKKEK